MYHHQLVPPAAVKIINNRELVMDIPVVPDGCPKSAQLASLHLMHQRLVDVTTPKTRILSSGLLLGNSTSPQTPPIQHFDPVDTFNRREVLHIDPSDKLDYVESAPLGSDTPPPQPEIVYDTSTSHRIHTGFVLTRAQSMVPTRRARATSPNSMLHTPATRIACWCAYCANTTLIRTLQDPQCLKSMKIRPIDELRRYATSWQLTDGHVRMMRPLFASARYVCNRSDQLVCPGYEEYTKHIRASRVYMRMHMRLGVGMDRATDRDRVASVLLDHMDKCVSDIVLEYLACAGETTDRLATAQTHHFRGKDGALLRLPTFKAGLVHPTTGPTSGGVVAMPYDAGGQGRRCSTKLPVACTARVTSRHNFSFILETGCALRCALRSAKLTVHGATATTRVWIQLVTSNPQSSCLFMKVPRACNKYQPVDDMTACEFDFSPGFTSRATDTLSRVRFVIQDRARMKLGAPVYVVLFSTLEMRAD